MLYYRQIEEIENYLRNREKDLKDFKIGAEFEHFIVDKDSLETKTYYDEDGVVSTLKELEKNGWTGDYEDGYILGAHKGNKVVTLEPGSQFEFSVLAQNDLKVIEKEYQEFIEEIEKILESKNQSLIAVGYHPVTSIDDIKLLPKKRYDYMFNYFKDKGKYAHNMMKGTAALQVSLDYRNEEDYRRKVRIANAMSPIMYGLCDNSFYFEGEELEGSGLRTNIWLNMDDARSGIVPGSLEDNFSYRKYADYILNSPPIFRMEDGEAINTGDDLVRDMFDPDDYKLEELEHLMTMVFPDVRTKGFIEIRMMDSLPYPLNFGVISLLKGLFYNDENLDRLYDKFKSARESDVIEAKKDILENGVEAKYLDRSILDWGSYLVGLAKNGLSKEDQKYLVFLEDLLDKGMNPYMLIEEKKDLGRKKALSHCILKDFEVV